MYKLFSSETCFIQAVEDQTLLSSSSSSCSQFQTTSDGESRSQSSLGEHH